MAVLLNDPRAASPAIACCAGADAASKLAGYTGVAKLASCSPRACLPYCRPPEAAGYILLDAIVGLSLLAILSAVLFGAVAQRQVAARTLADRRAAIRVAEAMLIALQSGPPSPGPTLPDAKVTVRPIDGFAADAGFRWVEVTADVRGQRRSLIGAIRKRNASSQRGAP